MVLFNKEKREAVIMVIELLLDQELVQSIAKEQGQAPAI